MSRGYGREGRLEPPAALGVLGSGQLGRMFVQAAQRMGFRTVVLSSTADAPAAQVAHEVIVGKDDDLETLGAFASRVQAVTVEFENVFAPALRWLAGRVPVRPGWRPIWISQNRLREKTFLRDRGFPLARWCPVRTQQELQGSPGLVGLPLILKTASYGYDGKGQVRVDEAGELEGAWASLKGAACVAEGVVDFVAEVSVVAARGHDGASTAFPVCWNQHSRHILDTSVAPAPVGPLVAREARELALGVASSLEITGVLTVEFFLSADGTLRINEVAPRPHNSGHLTIDAGVTTQFEQQVRALAGIPLGSAELTRPAAMVNLLGDLWEGAEPNWSAAMAADGGSRIHLYGKHSARVGRKMGHLTVLDPDPMQALERALAARRLLKKPRL